MNIEPPDKRTTDESASAMETTPGALRGEAWLTLHTRHAQSLFTGREPTPDEHLIVGVTRFGAMVSQILVCVPADDPYADWWLVKIEEELAQSATEIATLSRLVEELLQSTPTMEVTIAESLRPLRVPLRFRHAYAYNAARLLAQFDTLARGILTGRHVGLLNYEQSRRYLLLGSKAFRRALGAALGFRYTGVNRRDIQENNAKALEARERLGEVPADILNGSRRARQAPEAMATRSVSARAPSLAGWRRPTPTAAVSATHRD